jgi:hypothetical protein
MRLAGLAGPADWVAPMAADDYYGPNYLLDLALATRYVKGPVIGKAAHHVRSAEGVTLAAPERQYRVVDAVPARAGAIRADVADASLADFLADLATRRLTAESALSIDAFNYCRDAGAHGDEVRATVDDLAGLDTGMPFAEMTRRAEDIRLIERDIDAIPRLTGADLAPIFRSAKFVKFAADDGRLRVDSTLGGRQRRYRYATVTHTPDTLHADGDLIRLHMLTTPGLPLRVALRFLDAAGETLGGDASNTNRDVEFDLPEGTAAIQLGMRVSGPGSAFIPAILLDHRALPPTLVLGRGDHLVVTGRYPSRDDTGAGVDVHRAVLAARQAGHRVDVFRLGTADDAIAYHDHEGVDCITGPGPALDALIAGRRYRTVSVYHLDAATLAGLGVRLPESPVAIVDDARDLAALVSRFGAPR